MREHHQNPARIQEAQPRKRVDQILNQSQSRVHLRLRPCSNRDYLNRSQLEDVRKLVKDSMRFD